jgi:hypothetical protein
MKRTFMLWAAALMLCAPAFAQKSMDTANEKAVKITQGPTISEITPTGATIHWTTDRTAANNVRYRVAGSNGAWKTAYHSGGGTEHSLQLTGLEPGKSYEWEILTRDGDVRTAGQFQTPTSGKGPDVNASSAASSPATSAPSTPASSAGNGAVASGPKVALYREVGTTNGNHLYTTNASEQSGSFKMEGVTGYVMQSQAPGTVPLYRLTSATGDEMLTSDPNERASAMSSGYSDQGILGYISSSQQPGTTPLYKVTSTDNKSHFYTTSAGERDQLIGRGWGSDQGTVGYLWTSQ